MREVRLRLCIHIARPAGVHYNHCVSPSVRPLAVSVMNRTVYFDQILHTYACQHCLTTGMGIKQPFLMGEALLSIIPAGRDQLVKMLRTLEPHGIFG